MRRLYRLAEGAHNAFACEISDARHAGFDRPRATTHFGARRASAATERARLARRHCLRGHQEAHRLARAAAGPGRQRGRARSRAGSGSGSRTQRPATPGLGEPRRDPPPARHARRRARRRGPAGDLRAARRARRSRSETGRRARRERGARIAERARGAHARRTRLGRPPRTDRARSRVALGDRRDRGQHAARLAAPLVVRPRPAAVERGARPRRRAWRLRGGARRRRRRDPPRRRGGCARPHAGARPPLPGGLPRERERERSEHVMGQQVDAVIIGAGVIGTATAFELGKRGYRTLNVDKLPSAGYGPTSNSCAIVRAHYSSFDGVAMAYEGFFYWKNWAEYLEAP